MSLHGKIPWVASVALLGLGGWFAATTLRASDPVPGAAPPASGTPAPEARVTSLPSADPQRQVDEQNRRKLEAAIAAYGEGESPADQQTALEAVTNASAERSAKRLEAARRRFAGAVLNIELSREVDAELRSRFAALEVDARGLSDVECRDTLCRAELLLGERDLGRVAVAARQAEFTSTAIEVKRKAAGELRLVAFLERRPAAEREPDDSLPRRQ